MYLANYPNQSSPTIFTDEPFYKECCNDKADTNTFRQVTVVKIDPAK